jgi:hypothetical protein
MACIPDRNNETPPGGTGGAVIETIHAGAGIDFYPQYTPTPKHLQARNAMILPRLVIRAAVILADVGQALTLAADWLAERALALAVGEL